MTFDPYFLAITEKEQELLTLGLEMAAEYDFYFNIGKVTNTAQYLAKLKLILEALELNEIGFYNGSFREDQVYLVGEFLANLRLTSKALDVNEIPFAVDGIDLLLDNSSGLEDVTFYDENNDWSAVQQTAIVNSVNRLDMLREVYLYWIPFLDQRIYFTVFQLPCLRSLGLRITEHAIFEELIERMKRNSSLIRLIVDFNAWSGIHFQLFGQMLAENKVLRTLSLHGESSEIDSLAMHPFVQLNTTLSAIDVRSGIPHSALWGHCKSIFIGQF